MAITRDQLRFAALAAAQPASYLALLAVVMLVWHICSGPSGPEIIEYATKHLATTGLWIVAVAALIEGLAVASLWFPGSLILVVAMTAAIGQPRQAALIVAVITLSFCVAAQINYAAGRFGLYPLIARLGGKGLLDRTAAWYGKYGWYVLPLLFWHPSLSSFASVAGGQARMRWIWFLVLSVCAIATWNCAWGIALYYSARMVTGVIANPATMIIGLASWAILAFLVGLARYKPSQRCQAIDTSS